MQWHGNQYVERLEISDHCGKRFAEVVGPRPLGVILEVNYCSAYPTLKWPNGTHAFKIFRCDVASATMKARRRYSTPRAPRAVELTNLSVARIAYPCASAIASGAALWVDEVNREFGNVAERFDGCSL